MTTIENVAEVCRVPMFDVLDFQVIQFLNMMSYVTHKNNKLKEQYGK
jgi:hypothetical protein